MESLRKWFYKPKRDDPSLLAQFFYADEALNLVAAELDSFDGRKDPERCTALVNHLRQCQDKVLIICNRIMDDIIPTERANRDFRVKFPDDVMQENLAGQLWFGAECLAAGSSIMNREGESSAMRPLAKALTKALENVRNLLREQCLRGNTSNNSLKLSITSGTNEAFWERLQEALKIFDRLFAEFELSYVSAMVPVKSTKEYELQQLVVVLFSETLQRALKMKLLTQEMVDDYDPALMFTIPRLAIVSGLLIFPDGPLCLDRTPADMSEMFRPFRTLLNKIRELLWTLNKKELFTLEKLLCSSEEPGDFHTQGQQVHIYSVTTTTTTTTETSSYPTVPDVDDFVTRFYIDYPSCKQFVKDFCDSTTSRNIQEDTTQDAFNSKANQSSEVNNSSAVIDNHPQEVVSLDITSESEDETEWVGETSECETIVTEVYNEIENIENERKQEEILQQKNSPPSSSRSCTLPHQPGLREMMVFGEHISAVKECELQSSSPHASYSSPQEEESVLLESQSLTAGSRENSEDFNNLEHPDAVTIPTPSVSGFLLANQVGHDSILASVERLSGSRLPDLSPTAGESLSDADSREALSVATATLSTLLLSSPVRDREQEELHDSGLNTVVSCCDSSRSPGLPNNSVTECPHISPEVLEKMQKLPERWHVERISCNCSLGDKSSKSCPYRCGDHTTAESETWHNIAVEGCLASACVTINGKICDNALNASSFSKSENIVACQDCMLPVENFDKEDCFSSETSNYRHANNSYFISDNDASEVSFRELGSPQNSSEVTGVHRSCVVDDCDTRIVNEDCAPSNGSTKFESLKREEFDHAVKSMVPVPSIVIKTEEIDTERVKEHGVTDKNDQCSTHCSGKEISRIQISMPNDSIDLEQCEKVTTDGTVVVHNKEQMNGQIEGKRKSLNNVNTSPSGVQSASAVQRNLDVPLGSSYSSTSSSCRSSITASSDSCSMSSDTSSFNSECQDDEEIALAMQAAEIANRNEVRAKFRSSEDLVHRLFVCIAGVADQLQTNFAGDLRHILKCVFLMSATSCPKAEDEEEEAEESPVVSESIEVEQISPDGGDNDLSRSVENAEEALTSGWELESPASPAEVESPPPWIPDDMAPRCMSCQAIFTVMRRRHHCRNCGKIFCGRCSSNSVPLPRYGHVKPVRVCNRCFLYQVTPFTLQGVATRS